MQNISNAAKIRDIEKLKEKKEKYEKIMALVSATLREQGIDLESLTTEQKSLLSDYFTAQNEMVYVTNQIGKQTNNENQRQSMIREENEMEVGRYFDKVKEIEAFNKAINNAEEMSNRMDEPFSREAAEEDLDFSNR